MTSEDVRGLVEREIAGDWQRSNLHGCDLRRCLVSPSLVEYDNCGVPPLTTPPEVIRLWLVLEERPETGSGYKVVFGEETGMFGLAVRGEFRDAFIGYYGSFLEAFAAM